MFKLWANILANDARPQKNNHPFGIDEYIKLGLINFSLTLVIMSVTSDKNNKWYHCDDKHITETNLLTLSNNVYLVFYAKDIDIGT